MAYRIHIDPDANCAFIIHWGVRAPDSRETTQALLELRLHADYRRGMNILRDMRAMALTEESEMYVTTIALNEPLLSVYEDFDRQHGAARIAVLTGWPGDGAKESAFFDRLSHTPVERRLFQDLEEAKQWIGLPPDYEIVVGPPSSDS